MPFIAVLSLVLLFIAALGSTFWWRGPDNVHWYGGAFFYWGVFFLAVVLEFPILRALGL